MLKLELLIALRLVSTKVLKHGVCETQIIFYCNRVFFDKLTLNFNVVICPPLDKKACQR